MLAPRFLNKKLQGIEKEKQETIKQLITELRAAGIENPSKFFFRLNQQSNGKGTTKRKNKTGRGDGDEEYELFNGEEELSDDDDNDDSSRSKAKKKMNDVWRTAKSILVKKVIAASNEEERMKVQPPNIKLLHDWKDFVKEKTSANFKGKSDNFKEIRKKLLELQHTMSHKGYARLTAEMKEKKKSTSRVAVWAEGHKTKIGHPAKKKVEDKIALMEKIERETPKSSSTNLKEDALCKVLGPEKHGSLRTFGKGVSLTKLSILSQMSGHLAQLHEENVKYKSQVAHMQDTIDELKKNQAQDAATVEGTPTTPIVSPSRVTATPDSDSCKLLDWTGTGEVVAEGRWSSSDPNERVHHFPLGPNAMRVWVDVPKKGEAYLWRPISFLENIEDAVGPTVAWPADKVLMDSTPRSMG